MGHFIDTCIRPTTLDTAVTATLEMDWNPNPNPKLDIAGVEAEVTPPTPAMGPTSDAVSAVVPSARDNTQDLMKALRGRTGRDVGKRKPASASTRAASGCWPSTWAADLQKLLGERPRLHQVAGKRATFCMRGPMQKDGIERARKDNTAITPTGGYKVEGQVQGQSITLPVDTGAAVTEGCVGSDRPWAEQQLVSMDRSPLQVYGCASVELQFGGIPYPTDVVVVSPLTILGLDFLKKYGTTIDVRRCMMQMGMQATIRMPPSCADGVRVVSLVDSLTHALRRTLHNGTQAG